MRSFVGLLLSLHIAAAAAAAGPEPDLGRWRETAIPAEPAARSDWLLAANHSSDEWLVYTEGGALRARPTTSGKRVPRHADGQPALLRAAQAVIAVDDGWLAGFHRGEFGGGLYWYSADGSEKYRISDHAIVDLLRRDDGIYATEGVAHMFASRGSLLRVFRDGGRWQAATALHLPFAPYAATMLDDGGMLVTLSDALVSIDRNLALRTIVADAPWKQLYPNSSVLSADGDRLAIGMRSAVAMVDLPSGQLRLLVPPGE
ncbi:hypothetical protein [Pseudoduganella umbonata]|uniref:Uncharacterized protein n=1 Tax=Pseudoduganella umbonata TaxID=864828 RepID=A0A4P8HP87_9BURK|nr:hypothetical protein [Pseudoduganella umbonata]MBB3221058.1 hypothetical protein [Pseudoduganella umbonata]QCP10260.1 hypothetical protein FCL38_07340 [Pseudoduganella umbonata]